MEATSLASTCLQSCAPVRAILMWFAVEKKNVFFCFSAFLKQECSGRDVGGLACMYACPHVRFAVLSAGCAVIHCVTMNTYCEKEKKPPHVLSEGLVTAPFVEDNTQALTHATHTHTHVEILQYTLIVSACQMAPDIRQRLGIKLSERLLLRPPSLFFFFFSHPPSLGIINFIISVIIIVKLFFIFLHFFPPPPSTPPLACPEYQVYANVFWRLPAHTEMERGMRMRERGV